MHTERKVLLVKLFFGESVKKEKVMIEENVVKKVSQVARLELTGDEIKKFSADLNNILEAFKSLEKIETSSVEPTFQPIPVNDVFREDKAEKHFDQETALINVKTNKEDGHFKGPKVT